MMSSAYRDWYNDLSEKQKKISFEDEWDRYMKGMEEK